MARPVGRKNKSKKYIKEQKNIFLIEYAKSLNISKSAEAANFSRKTFYNYYEQDQQFKSDFDEIKEACIDTAEAALYQQIKKGNVQAIIHYLRIHGRHRGWAEDNKTSVTIEPPVRITYITPEGCEPIDILDDILVGLKNN